MKRVHNLFLLFYTALGFPSYYLCSPVVHTCSMSNVSFFGCLVYRYRWRSRTQGGWNHVHKDEKTCGSARWFWICNTTWSYGSGKGVPLPWEDYHICSWHDQWSFGNSCNQLPQSDRYPHMPCPEVPWRPPCKSGALQVYCPNCSFVGSLCAWRNGVD